MLNPARKTIAALIPLAFALAVVVPFHADGDGDGGDTYSAKKEY